MPRLTLGDLDARVLARVDGNALLYTQAERYNAINEAIRVLNLATGFIQVTLPVATWSIVNRVWYDVPAGIVIPLRVQYENTYLGRLSLKAIGLSTPGWTQETTVTAAQPVTNWVPFGLTKFGIYPAATIGGSQILVTGVAEPAPLVNPADSVSFPNQVDAAFDLLAVHTLQLKESGQAFAAASADYQGFLRIMNKIVPWRGWTAPRYFISEAQQPSNK
jgi:hypothetical protein